MPLPWTIRCRTAIAPRCVAALRSSPGSQPEGQLGGYHLTSGNSCIERLQAARHSTLLMCVAASQKPMQSASALPPPPGLLGADWLGLPLPDEVPGERARLERAAAAGRELAGQGLGHGRQRGRSGLRRCWSVGVVVAGTPAGGVSPAEGVGDNDVDGVAGVVEPGDAWGVAGKVVVGAESLGSARRRTRRAACRRARLR